jgi:DNA-binding transcriptional LysR family regulator
MHSEDLLMFLGVAENGNLSRAAVEIGLSQSALSRRISALESELNTRLFYRSGRGLMLTESGHRLIAYAQTIKKTLDEANADLLAPAHQGPSSIVLAAPPTIAKILFGSIGKSLQERYPGIKMRFKEGLAGHIHEWVASGEIDAAIAYLPENRAFLGAVDVILRERLSFIAPMQFGPLPASFPLERLAEVPMIVPSPSHGIRTRVEAFVAQHSKSLQIAMECDSSVYITRQLVVENCGCTILPIAAVYEELQAGKLQATRLEPDMVRDVAIISGRNRPPIPAQWEVLRTIRQIMVELVESGKWPDAEVAEGCSA